MSEKLTQALDAKIAEVDASVESKRHLHNAPLESITKLLVPEAAEYIDYKVAQVLENGKEKGDDLDSISIENAKTEILPHETMVGWGTHEHGGETIRLDVNSETKVYKHDDGTYSISTVFRGGVRTGEPNPREYAIDRTPIDMYAVTAEADANGAVLGEARYMRWDEAKGDHVDIDINSPNGEEVKGLLAELNQQSTAWQQAA